jgi:uncharacterized protein YjbJ (UPF0337 family)
MGIKDKLTGKAKKLAGDAADDPRLRRRGEREEQKGEKQQDATEARREAERLESEAEELDRRSG